MERSRSRVDDVVPYPASPALRLVWETRPLVVQLDLAIPYPSLGALPSPVRRKSGRIVAMAVKQKELEGWVPAGPVDLASLWHEGRVTTATKPHRTLGAFAKSYTLESATVELKRLVLCAPGTECWR
ncbi:MAG: hypothetical protein HY329_26635 [Chloroflexi bacterium]|nr:hypothetical protein [Chloroflexota bacterium]